MNHQPFDMWLFEEEALSPDQDRALADHLESCEHCRALAAAWRAVEGQLHSTSQIEPAPGFTQRWLASLADDRQRAGQRQLSIVLLSTTIGLVTLTLLFGAQLLPLLQPVIPAITQWFSKIIGVIAHLNLVGEIYSILFEIMVEGIPIVYRVALPISLAGLSAMWIVSLYRLSFQNLRREF
jgi:hypothetical protein